MSIFAYTNYLLSQISLLLSWRNLIMNGKETADGISMDGPTMAKPGFPSDKPQRRSKPEVPNPTMPDKAIPTPIPTPVEPSKTPQLPVPVRR